MKSKWLTVGLLSAAFLWAGCATAQVQAVRHTATGIEPREAIAFVSWSQFSVGAGDAQPIDEKVIATCVSDAVHKTEPSLRIVSPDEFRRAGLP